MHRCCRISRSRHCTNLYDPRRAVGKPADRARTATVIAIFKCPSSSAPQSAHRSLLWREWSTMLSTGFRSTHFARVTPTHSVPEGRSEARPHSQFSARDVQRRLGCSDSANHRRHEQNHRHGRRQRRRQVARLSPGRNARQPTWFRSVGADSHGVHRLDHRRTQQHVVLHALGPESPASMPARSSR